MIGQTPLTVEIPFYCPECGIGSEFSYSGLLDELDPESLKAVILDLFSEQGFRCFGDVEVEFPTEIRMRGDPGYHYNYQPGCQRQN